MTRECVTHHHACDCREEKFAAIEAECDSLRKELLSAHGQCQELMEERDRYRAALEKVGDHFALLSRLAASDKPTAVDKSDKRSKWQIVRDEAKVGADYVKKELIHG